MDALNGAVGVWKTTAQEYRHIANVMTRTTVGASCLLLIVSAYAISTGTSHARLCEEISAKSETGALLIDREYATGLVGAFCG